MAGGRESCDVTDLGEDPGSGPCPDSRDAEQDRRLRVAREDLLDLAGEAFACCGDPGELAGEVTDDAADRRFGRDDDGRRVEGRLEVVDDGGRLSVVRARRPGAAGVACPPRASLWVSASAPVARGRRGVRGVDRGRARPRGAACSSMSRSRLAVRVRSCARSSVASPQITKTGAKSPARRAEPCKTRKGKGSCDVRAVCARNSQDPLRQPAQRHAARGPSARERRPARPTCRSGSAARRGTACTTRPRRARTTAPCRRRCRTAAATPPP